MNQTREKPDKKVVIIGDIGVGKTCFLQRYIEDVFVTGETTIGTSFYVKQWNGKNISLWDTAGQERFDGLRGIYCRGAHAIILCYNICDRNSFLSLRKKHSKSFEDAAERCMVVLVGTKSDLVHQSFNGIEFKREVSVDDAMEEYLRYKVEISPLGHPSGTIPIFETSAKSGSNVTAVFEYIFQTLVPSSDKVKKDDYGMVRLLERSPSEENRKCCT